MAATGISRRYPRNPQDSTDFCDSPRRLLPILLSCIRLRTMIEAVVPSHELTR
jgi:hypothetical protein